MPGEYYNVLAADWARQNLASPVHIRPIGSSRFGSILIYLLCFSVPLIFLAFGIVSFALGVRDRSIVGGSIFFGILMLVPAAMIAFAGWYARRGFAGIMDGDGVIGAQGQRFPWGKLYYVDHVSKRMRAGGVSRVIKDNQIELVFETGKVVIPPLIRDRDRIWDLIGLIPVQVRDDGVPRQRPNAEAEFLEFINNV